MKVAVILAAAGQSKRFAAGPNKSADPLLDQQHAKSKVETKLAGTPVFLRAIKLFTHRSDVSQILLAVNPDGVDDFKFRWGDHLVFQDVDVVPGGKAERWETVLNALEALDDDITHVAVHDAARPLTSPELIERVFAAAGEHDAVIPGLPVAATLKRYEPMEAEAQADAVDAILGDAGKPATGIMGRVSETVSRNHVVAIETPQVFEVNLLRRAYQQITDGKIDTQVVTDDAGLVEALGERVVVVEGEPTNIKITHPSDMKLAHIIAKEHDTQHDTEIGKARLFGPDDDED